MTTREAIKAITDRALFERLGNSVLRLVFPELKNLVASGINEKGENIKDPIDAYAQITRNQVAWVAHTTDDTNLERKWLNERATKRSPLGDLISLIRAAREKRSYEPNTEIVIYLVTNQRVSSKLYAKARSKILDDFISLEIVDNSVIGDFLDNNPEGQYLRKQFLQIEAELLSDSLLKDIIDRNVANYGIEIFMHQRELIETSSIDELQKELNSSIKKLGLIIAESGGGKSTAAFAVVKNYIKKGAKALRIDPRVINVSNGIYDAIEKQLGKEHSKLFIQDDILKKFFSKECLIVIDDINKHENANALLEKLISWMQVLSEDVISPVIICPVWPRNLSSLENALSKEQYFKVIKLKKPTYKDSVTIIQKTLLKTSVRLSDAEVDSVLRETKDDLLLLTLYLDLIVSQNGYRPNHGQEVIERFVDERLAAISTKTNTSEILLKTCLQKFGFQMLHNRSINPNYDELEKWFHDDLTDKQTLNLILGPKLLFDIDRNGFLIFRHDRIRDYILTLSFQSLLVDINTYSQIIEDPYYAELLGVAIANKNLSEEDVDLLLELNPLSVYNSLKFLQADSTEKRRKIVEAGIIKWNSQLKQKPIHNAVLHAISFSLIGFDIKNSLEVTKDLPESIEINLARFRNGDVESGIKYFMYHNWFIPTFPNYWRDTILDHVRKNHYEKVLERTQHFLSVKVTEKARPNVYLLAGYLRSHRLIKHLRKQWLQNQKNEDILHYIWAVINCFSPDQVETLTEAFDSWMTLEELKNEYDKPTGLKNEIFIELSRSYWELNEDQIKILVKLLENPQYDRLIYSVINYADSPAALGAVIAKLAHDRQRDGEDWVSIAESSEDRWDFKKEETRLSEESRTFLLSFWKNGSNDAKQRYFAFRFWYGNEEPNKVIEQLKQINSNDESIYDSSLLRRVRLGDRSVNKQLFELIGRKWWGIRHIDEVWNEESKIFFKRWFKKTIDDQNREYFDTGLAVLRKINQHDAEEILVEFWESIRLMHNGFLTALFIATPKTRELAKEEINRLGFDKWEIIKDYYLGPAEGHYILSEEVEKIPQDLKVKAAFLAEEFGFAYFNYSDNKKNNLTLEQLNSLLPYLSLIGKHSLGEFAGKAIRNGYPDWMEQHLLPLLSPDDKKRLHPDNNDIVNELGDYLNVKDDRDIERFIKRLDQRAVGHQRFIECLKLFLEKHNSLSAFQLLCRCIEEVGTRQDPVILDNYKPSATEDNEKAEKMKANIFFKVFRKTLQ